MKQEEIEEVVDIQELESNLTKRNEQYVFDLKKALTASNMPKQEQDKVLAQILPQLIEGQKSGVTARQLFGTVSEHTKNILDNPIVTRGKDSKPVFLWLDNTLLLFAFIGVLLGGMELITKKKSSMSFGIITMIVCALAGGLVFLFLYEYIYKYDQPGADRSKKPGLLKSGAVMFGVMFLWIILFSLTSVVIPASINVVPDPVVSICLGAAAFLARRFIKKKYNIQGGYFGR